MKRFHREECQCALSENDLYCIVNYRNEYVKLWNIKSRKFNIDFFNSRDFFVDLPEDEIYKLKLKWGYPFYAIVDDYKAEIRSFDYFSESKGNSKLIATIHNIEGIYITNIDFRNIEADEFTYAIIKQFIKTKHD